MPTEQEVTSFLDECCEVARSAVETRLAATRSAAASSLGMDEYGLDKKFASNCINERIKRQLNVTLTAGGEPPDIAPTDIGRRQEEQELNAAIAATSTAEAAAHQSEGGAGEGRGKRVKKTPKHFGTN